MDFLEAWGKTSLIELNQLSDALGVGISLSVSERVHHIATEVRREEIG